MDMFSISIYHQAETRNTVMFTLLPVTCEHATHCYMQVYVHLEACTVASYYSFNSLPLAVWVSCLMKC